MAKGGIFSIWGRRRRDSIDVARDALDSLNARDWDGFRDTVNERLVYIDSFEQRIEGREAFIDAFRQFAKATPGLRAETDTYSHGSDSILVRGTLLADDPDFRSDTLWQVEVRDGRMTRLHAFRRNEGDVPLVRLHREGKATA